MKFRILASLYLFYLTYRLIYWGLDNLLSVSVNAALDTAVSFLMANLIYRSIEGVKESENKTIALVLSIFYFILACVALWTLHWATYTLVNEMTETFKQSFYSFTFQFFDVITLLSIGGAITYAWLKNIEVKTRTIQYKKLIEENRIAELKFLKSQVNPHFIFNTLNAINFSIDKENTQARSLVGDFADLFRYQLYESDQDYILLEKEISFVKKYINIYEVRMNETFNVDINVEGKAEAKLLPPLLLIPFIENSFKHSSNHFSEKSIITISIKVHDLILEFRISNSKRKSTVPERRGEGMGLNNVKKRLEILFPGSHTMNLKEEEETFEVFLKIPLKEEGF